MSRAGYGCHGRLARPWLTSTGGQAARGTRRTTDLDQQSLLGVGGEGINIGRRLRSCRRSRRGAGEMLEAGRKSGWPKRPYDFRAVKSLLRLSLASPKSIMHLGL